MVLRSANRCNRNTLCVANYSILSIRWRSPPRRFDRHPTLLLTLQFSDLARFFEASTWDRTYQSVSTGRHWAKRETLSEIQRSRILARTSKHKIIDDMSRSNEAQSAYQGLIF